MGGGGREEGVVRVIDPRGSVEEGYWKHSRHMYVVIVGKDDNLLGNGNGNQKTWGIFLFGENCGYGHYCLALEVVVEKQVCCLNCQAGSGKHLD